MKPLILALLLAAQNDPRIAEGIALHDQRKYDEAIAKYQAVLADAPGSVLARYEMAFAYQAKGDAANCKAAIEPIVEVSDKQMQPLILTTYGNCLDMLGESKKAIGVYRKGLKTAPNDPQLLYNLAIALIGQKEIAEARELLKKELAVRPGHGSGHFALAKIFDAQGLRAAALLEYLRLLAVDFQTPLRPAAAKRVAELLGQGVEGKAEGGANININPNPPTDEGDFKGFDMMMSLLAAGRFTEEAKKLSEFEQLRTHLSLSLTMLLENPPKGRTYTIRENIPFFQEMQKRKLLEVFAGIAIAPLGLAGTEEWGKTNDAAIREYGKWIEGQPR